ncbi:MAG: molybdopterin cofactor-binding domain-containing protein [Pseudomonadota bacterium]
MGKWTRRTFIGVGALAGGGILVGVAIRPGNLNKHVDDHVAGEGETLVHVYVKIDKDNVITVIVPHSEMGQGAQTALTQMLAEELDADWRKIRFEEAPALKEYAMYTVGRGELLKNIDFPKFIVPSIDAAMMRLADTLDAQITGGSLSIRVTGEYGMRVAGAATRDMLKQAAAQTWDVPFDEIETERSMLIHEPSARVEPYSAVAELAATMNPSYVPTLKDPKDFKIIGQPIQRFDIPAKVDGTARFALDVRLPDMVYATIQRSPIVRGRLASIDDTAARAVKGVLDVVKLPVTEHDALFGDFIADEAVAVIANGYWAAHRGLRALDIQWDGNDQVSSETIRARQYRELENTDERETDIDVGGATEVLATADKIVSADYHVPYLAHACMEPLNATADFRDGKCEVWVGCQNPLGFRRAIATSLGLHEDDVTLHNLLMGGGFGRKSTADWAMQAALLSQRIGRPVQLIWSREEDMRQDFYRPALPSRFKAALGNDGEPLAWQNTYVSKMEPVEAPVVPYAIKAKDIGYVPSEHYLPIGPWRSVDESQHGFFVESFIDECAHAAGVDPFVYRANLLQEHPRHLAVLERAAKEANWNQPMGPGRGRGIALKESFGTIVAEVAEVSLVHGEVVMDRFVVVADPGLAVNPDGFAAQMESGVIYGLTAAIYGEITVQDGAVVQSNFHDYEALRISASPVIETHIINSGHKTGGAGEPGTPPAAPALANAIFAATGQRIRELPLRKHISFSTGAQS